MFLVTSCQLYHETIIRLSECQWEEEADKNQMIQQEDLSELDHEES